MRQQTANGNRPAGWKQQPQLLRCTCTWWATLVTNMFDNDKNDDDDDDDDDDNIIGLYSSCTLCSFYPTNSGDGILWPLLHLSV